MTYVFVIWEIYMLWTISSSKVLRVLRDWSKSTGGWAGAFRNVVVRKHMTHPFQLEQNRVTHP